MQQKTWKFTALGVGVALLGTLLAAGGVSAQDISGKLRATGGVSTVEGSGGGGLATWALITAWGDSRVVEQANNDPSGLLPTATERYLGAAGLHIIQVLFVTSLFACILSFHNIVARYVFTLSNRRVFPDRLGDVRALALDRERPRPHGRAGVLHLRLGLAGEMGLVDGEQGSGAGDDCHGRPPVVMRVGRSDHSCGNAGPDGAGWLSVRRHNRLRG